MGMMEMDTSAEMSLDSYSSMVMLDGCMVSSPIYNVVFRATPGGDDIGRVKYRTCQGCHGAHAQTGSR